MSTGTVLLLIALAFVYSELREVSQAQTLYGEKVLEELRHIGRIQATVGAFGNEIVSLIPEDVDQDDLDDELDGELADVEAIQGSIHSLNERGLDVIQLGYLPGMAGARRGTFFALARRRSL